MANADLRDEEQIRQGIARAQFVQKGGFLSRQWLEIMSSNLVIF